MFAPDENHVDKNEFLHQTGAQAPSNTHVERLGGILLTYNFFEKKLGEFYLYLLTLTSHNFITSSNGNSLLNAINIQLIRYISA